MLDPLSERCFWQFDRPNGFERYAHRCTMKGNQPSIAPTRIIHETILSVLCVKPISGNLANGMAKRTTQKRKDRRVSAARQEDSFFSSRKRKLATASPSGGGRDASATTTF